MELHTNKCEYLVVHFGKLSQVLGMISTRTRFLGKQLEGQPAVTVFPGRETFVKVIQCHDSD